MDERQVTDVTLTDTTIAALESALGRSPDSLAMWLGDRVYFLYSNNKWECYSRADENKLVSTNNSKTTLVRKTAR